MDVVLGLGQTGHQIAYLLSLLKMEADYFSIDDEEVEYEGFKHIKIPRFNNPEDYEAKFPSVKKHFKKTKNKKELLLITGGGENLSLSSLSLLGQIKNLFEINVLYVKPSNDMLVNDNKLKERAVFGVFQECARSGMFKMLYIVSKEEIDFCLGHLPILVYDEKINDTIASAFNMINSFQNSKSVLNTFHAPLDPARIATFGIVDMEEDEDRMFYSLDNISDTIYYFGYMKKSLETDGSILGNIKQMIKNREPSEEMRISYGVYATSYAHDLIYCVKYSTEIQENE